MKTAEALHEKGHKVAVVSWEYSGIRTSLPVIIVEDVNDYFEKVLAYKADAYILAAAVANLAPLKPFKGKFPSHKYKAGDIFPIDFTITPRVIDRIKDKYPSSTLIGYKLFDGSDEELISAGQKTLFESRANIVFANHPAWAKERKIVITADGATFNTSFDGHVELIDRLIREKFYKTKIIDGGDIKLTKEGDFIIRNYPKHKSADMIFGTFAVRIGKGFITTTRGKREGEKAIAFVWRVDHGKKIVYANRKATLNAPLLDLLLSKNSQINFIIHGHELIGKKIQNEYQFPGTAGDLKNVIKTSRPSFLIRLPYHGYIAGFADFSECKKFINNHKYVG